MADINPGQHYCEKCRKTMSVNMFYTYKDGTKAELCKPCMTMHINNWEPDTFLWLLEKFDVPYIEAEWNVLRDRAYAKDPYKMTGMSVFGKYLSKMKLKQWKNYTWADTERLKQEAEEKAKLYGETNPERAQSLELMKQAYENGEINEAQYKTYAAIEAPQPAPEISQPNSAYPLNDHPFEEVAIDIGADLTEEDKIYLAMKWGRLYRADEWVSLEQLYNDFMNSFDIQGAGRVDTLKMICKTSLKMNQAIDCGDIDSYQKLSRVYDAMMKSAKFTEAQNKDGNSQEFDSVGAIVRFCEKEGGFIPEYEITAPKDIVDTVLQDNKDYLQTLIHNDTNLSQQIEQYLKKREILDEQKKNKQLAKEQGIEAVAATNEDYANYYNQISEQQKQDLELIMQEEDE